MALEVADAVPIDNPGRSREREGRGRLGGGRPSETIFGTNISKVAEETPEPAPARHRSPGESVPLERMLAAASVRSSFVDAEREARRSRSRPRRP